MSERLDLSRTNIGLDEVLEECYRLQEYERLYLESVAVATTLRERVRVLDELVKRLNQKLIHYGGHRDKCSSEYGSKCNCDWDKTRGKALSALAGGKGEPMQELRKLENDSWGQAIAKNLDAQAGAIARAPASEQVGLMDNMSLIKGLFRDRGFTKEVDSWERRRGRNGQCNNATSSPNSKPTP